MSIRHTLQLHPTTGKYHVRIRRNGVSKNIFFTKNQRESERMLREFEKGLAAGKVSLFSTNPINVIRDDGSKDMRLDTLAHLHLDWVKNNRSQGTYANRKFYVQIFLDFMGEAMVSNVTRPKLEDFYTHAKKNHRRGDGRNAGCECMSNIKTMLKWGYEMELVDLAYRKFPAISREKPETKRLSDEEIAFVISKADSDLRDLIHFALLTGLRPIELRLLTKEHLRHAADGSPYISIEHHKTINSCREHKPRSVPLPPEAEAIIERQIQLHPQSEYFFLNDVGTPYDSHVLGRRLSRFRKRLGMKKSLCPYSFRHTYASMQSDANQETNSLMSLMGHSTTRTLQRYVSNTYKHHYEAVNSHAKRLQKLIETGKQECKPDAKVTTKLTTDSNHLL